ncbi:MAG: hypothetical protein GX590_01410 [Lentisphaerae bacterium]|nr:hypothetical protein [Lentisphaerota bacterium]
MKRHNSSGGGYGGRGGGTGGGAVYGRADLPLAPGSPGGWYVYSTGLRAGQGGGAIRLLAGGDIHLDGTLSANAMERELNYGGVGASGGGIFVAARRLTGDGLMRANGALNYSRTNADGGGGRIAVWVGLPLATVEARIAAGAPGVTRRDGYTPFAGGSFEVLRASDAAQDGTAGIYGLAGTVLLVR